MSALPSVPVSNGWSTAGRDRPSTVLQPGQRAQVGDGLVQQLVGGRSEGQRQAGRGVGRRGGIHERRAVPVEHRPEEALDESLVLLRPRDVALMGQQPVRQPIGPVEGCQLLHRGVGLEVEERQGVIPAVPGEEGGVAVTVGHVEGPAEGFDPVVAEERGAAVLHAGRHPRLSSSTSSALGSRNVLDRASAAVSGPKGQ